MNEPVTVSITRSVAPDRVLEADAWARAGQELARHEPGYLGSGWVRDSRDATSWHMLYRFADRESLERWQHSPARQWWLRSAEDMVTVTREEHRTGIEGWFDAPQEVVVSGRPETVGPPVPPRWKQAVAIFLPFFPLNLLVTLTLAHWLDLVGVPLVARVFLTVCLMTPLMTYLFLPLSTRLLQPWLHRGLERPDAGGPDVVGEGPSPR